MKSVLLVLAFGAAQASIHAGEHVLKHSEKKASSTEQSKDNVISKVIEMLESERGKIASDVAAESKEMAAYAEWCDNEISETGYEIRTATRKVEDLSAVIEDRTAQIAALDQEIASLGTEIADTNTEMDEANALRKKGEEEFKKNEEEQQLMIDELEKMEIELKQQMEAMTTPPPVPVEGEAEAAPAMTQTFDSLVQVPKKAGLVQKEAHQNKKKGAKGPKGPSLEKIQRALAKMVNTVWVDPASKKALGQINGFMQSDGMEEPAEGTPAPTVEIGAEAFGAMQQNTESNLAAFEMLKGKAEESLQRLRNNEQQEKHNHDLRIQSLLDAIHLSEDKLDDTKRDHSRLSEEKAKAESEKADTEASKAASEKSLAEVQLTCDKAAAAWAARQKGAKEEMAAIAKAKDILASRVTVLVQSNEPDDDATVSKQSSKLREALVAHFRKLGGDLHSLAMLNLVSVSSTEPLAQVKQLLKELTAKLEKEAAEAANLHQFCQEEKKKTTDAKEKKSMTIETLETRLDKANAKSAQLKEDIAMLSEEISTADAAQKEATEMRAEEHATFLKAEADLKEAADAVGDAIDALKDYYGDASLVQIQTVAGQPKLGGAKSDSAGGILSILDMMQGEFMKGLAAAQSDEREAVKAYDTQTQDFKVSKATKEAEIKGAESEVKSLAVAIHNFSEDYKMASAELASIMEYMDKLKPQCEGRVTPYEERKARREAEIQGLKDALSIIEKDAPALIQIRRLRH